MQFKITFYLSLGLEEDSCLTSVASIIQTEFKTCPDANVILLIKMHSRTLSQGWACDENGIMMDGDIMNQVHS